MGAFDSVHVSGGNQDPPPVLESDHRFGTAGDDFEAVLELTPGQTTTLRRLDGVLYVDTGDGFSVVDDAEAATGLLPAFAAWNPLVDLRDAIQATKTLRILGPSEIDGESVTSYAFTLDVAALPSPSLVVPGSAAGSAEATLSLDADDLPVRLELDLGPAISRIDYADWGTPVTIEQPATT